MSAAKLNTTKRPKTTPSKRSAGKSARSTPELDTPVFFRLPDLNAAPAPETSKTFTAAEPAPATELTTTAPSPPKAEKTKNHGRRRWGQVAALQGQRYYRSVSRSLDWASRIPMVGPALALSTALLITAAIIYTPWQNAKPTAQHPGEINAQPNNAPSTPFPAERSSLVDTSTKAISPNTTSPQAPSFDIEPAAVETSRPLKKVATELDQQLVASESTQSLEENEPDDEVDSAPEGEAEESNFTAPWWRRRPDPRATASAVAADTMQDPSMPSDEEPLDDGEEISGSRSASPRTAYRDRRTNGRVEPRYEEAIDDSESLAAYHEDLENDVAAPVAPQQRRRRTPADETAPPREALTEDTEEAAPRSPWQRIRHERLERESSRNDGPAEQPAARAQYRSPPGQDIDLEETWSTDAAKGPRGVSPKKGAR